MWNYTFTLPSVLVLAIVLIYYFLRPRLRVSMNRRFLLLLFTDILTILFDYVSSRYDETFQGGSVVPGYLLNGAFFVCFLARIFCFVLFTVGILRAYTNFSRAARAFLPVVFLLAEAVVLSSPLTHAVFFMDQDGYHRGSLYSVIYICFFYYLFLMIVMICACGKKLPRAVLVSLLCCQLILVAGNVVRILIPNYLVMNTFCLLAIMILFLTFENPDLYLSDLGYAYNTRAFRMLLREWDGVREYQIIGIGIRNYFEFRGICSGKQIDQMLSGIGQFLMQSYPAGTVFYLRNGCFALTFLKSAEYDAEQICREIEEQFDRPWKLPEGELSAEVTLVRFEAEQGERIHVERVFAALLLEIEEQQSETAADSRAPVILTVDGVNRQMELRQRVENALTEGKSEIFLQPLVDAKTGRMVAAEALARLRDEGGRLISPNEFISIAEKNGQINRLGEQVFDHVCRFVSEQDLDAMGLSWINVNLSPVQCMKKNLSENFEKSMKRYGVSVNRIHLEITEQSMLDFSLLKNQIEALTGQGFAFALDDYGTGHSNLIRVRQYPFSHIKLDMELVWAHMKNPDPMLPALVQTFHQMNYRITAEGIESEEMAEEMRRIGCDYLQGYYYSKPLPVAEFVEGYGQAAQLR